MGCDISSSSVKLVEIAEAGRNVYRVERYAIEPLPKDTVVDGNIANIEAAGEALKRAHKALGSRIKNIALALPGRGGDHQEGDPARATSAKRTWKSRSRARPTSTSRSPWTR